MSINLITCEWAGRSLMDIRVFGATNHDEARDAAVAFFNSELDGDDMCVGIVVADKGHHSTWDYEEPQSDDWKDSYFFRTVDEYPVDQREWWETA